MKKGFTLIELLVVICIIAILSGILVPEYSTYINKAKENKAEQIGRLIYLCAMKSYILDESFNKQEVENSINTDVSIGGLTVNIEDPKDEASEITIEFKSDNKAYEVMVYGDTSSYTFISEQ